MRKILALGWRVFNRELRRIRKDFDIISIILLAPLLYTFLYGSFYILKTESDVPVAVIDYDNSPESRDFIKNLDASQLISVEGITGSFDKARQMLYRDNIQGVVFIPDGFGRDMLLNSGTSIKLYLNTQRFLPSNDINKSINEIIIEYAQKNRVKIFNAKGFNSEQARFMAEPLKEDIRYIGNPTGTYGDFILPGLFLLIFQQTLLMGLSESIAKENEESGFRSLFRTGRFNIPAIMGGKAIFYFLLYFTFAVFFYTVQFSIFKVNFAGSYPVLLTFTVLFLLTIIVHFFIAGTFFKSKMFALQVMAFTSYPVFFISGYAWPASAMPGILVYISQLIPITPFFSAYIRIVEFGADLKDVLPEIIHLFILLIAGTGILLWRLKHIKNRLHKEHPHLRHVN
jgi:ABC-2 type transport system permease protein